MKKLFTLIIGLSLICNSHAAQTNEAPAVVAPMSTRALPLDSTVLSQMRLQVPPKKDETSQDFLLRYFKSQKIEFKKPAYFQFDEANDRLTVHMTAIDLQKVEQAVSKFEKKD